MKPFIDIKEESCPLQILTMKNWRFQKRKEKKKKTRIQALSSTCASYMSPANYLTSLGRIFHSCEWGSKLCLFCEVRGFWWFMTGKVLRKLCSKTNVKTLLAIKETKKTFCSVLLKVNRQKIYCSCTKEISLCLWISPGNSLQPPDSYSGSVCMTMIPWMSPGKISDCSYPSRACLTRTKKHPYPSPNILITITTHSLSSIFSGLQNVPSDSCKL